MHACVGRGLVAYSAATGSVGLWSCCAVLWLAVAATGSVGLWSCCAVLWLAVVCCAVLGGMSVLGASWWSEASCFGVANALLMRVLTL
jgi:hypothetical protein